MTGNEMTTSNSGNGGNGGDRRPANDDSSAGGVGGNDDTGGDGDAPSVCLTCPGGVVFDDTTHRFTTGTDPDDNPAPGGATGLAGANLQNH